MDTVNGEEVTTLLGRAGVTPSPADRRQLQGIREKYLERLKALHALKTRLFTIATLSKY